MATQEEATTATDVTKMNGTNATKECKRTTSLAPPPYSSTLNVASVKITVGSAECAEPFHLPPGLLKSVSVYFQSCLSGNFTESTTNEIKLEQTDPTVFHQFIDWLLRNKPNTALQPDDQVKLWIFADSIVCNGLQNCAMDGLRSYQGPERAAIKCLELLKIAVENTAEGSMLIRYLTEKIAFGLRTLPMEGALHTSPAWNELPSESAKQILQKFVGPRHALVGTVDPGHGKGCLYHVHDSSDPAMCPNKTIVAPNDSKVNTPTFGQSTGVKRARFRSPERPLGTITGRSLTPNSFASTVVSTAPTASTTNPSTAPTSLFGSVGSTASAASMRNTTTAPASLFSSTGSTASPLPSSNWLSIADRNTPTGTGNTPLRYDDRTPSFPDPLGPSRGRGRGRGQGQGF